MNAAVETTVRMQNNVSTRELSWRWPLLMLVARSILFTAWQAVIALALAWRGDTNAWWNSAAWWPWAAIMANLCTMVLLASLFRSEGGSLFDLYRFDRKHIKGDLLVMLGFTLIMGPIGYLPNLLVGNWLFGSAEVPFAMMFRSIPMWAAVSAMILFPITNGLVELPTYFGYCMPRLESLSGKAWFAVLLASFGLAFQHVALPWIFDPRFIAWRLLMFIPFALVVGLIVHWRPRLMPYMVFGHILIDATVVVFTLIASM